jgi:cell division protein FtsL
MVLFSMLVLALALVRVHRRHQVIRIGYELSEQRAELRALQEKQKRLRLEQSVLTNPERIEKLAKSLGMIRPKPDQIEFIPRKMASKSPHNQSVAKLEREP